MAPEAVRTSLEAGHVASARKTNRLLATCRESRSNEDAANCILLPTKVAAAALAVAMLTGAGAPTFGATSASPPRRTHFRLVRLLCKASRAGAFNGKHYSAGGPHERRPI
jgi:hypothetical protein